MRKFFNSRSHQKKGLAKDPVLTEQLLSKVSVRSKGARIKMDPEMRIRKAKPAQHQEANFPMPLSHPLTSF